MQSYHAALLTTCAECVTAAKTKVVTGLDKILRLVNAKRRREKLCGPAITLFTCLDALLEHACYLLRTQRRSTQQQNTGWITDVAVGQYLRDLGRSWVVLIELSGLYSSSLSLAEKLQDSGILQPLAEAANKIRAQAAASTPQTLQSSCTIMGIGIAIFCTQMTATWPDSMLSGPSLGQLTLAVLRMIFRLLILIASRPADQPTIELKDVRHAFIMLVSQMFKRALRGTKHTALKAAPELPPFLSEPLVLRAAGVVAALSAMQLRKVQKARTMSACSSSTRAVAVPLHHVALLSALKLPEGAAAALMNAGDGDLADYEAFTMPYVVAAVSAVGLAFTLMIDVLFVGVNNDSSRTNSNVGRPYQQPATSRPPGVLQVPEQQADLLLQQQLSQSLLPLVLGVLYKLQQLAQQLQDDMQQPHPKGVPSNVCQHVAFEFMQTMCGQLTLAALSEQQRPQQGRQQLLRVTLAQCFGHLEAAVRGHDKVGKPHLEESVRTLHNLLAWARTTSAPASQPSGNVSRIITTPGISSMLLSCFKCQTAWLRMHRSAKLLNTDNSSSSGVYVADAASEVASVLDQLPLTAKTGVSEAAAALAATAVTTLTDAAAAGLVLAGRSMYLAGDMATTCMQLQTSQPYRTAAAAAALPMVPLPWFGIMNRSMPLAEVIQALHDLLPQLQLPGESAAAGTAAAELLKQAEQLCISSKQAQLRQLPAHRHADVIVAMVPASAEDSRVAEQLKCLGAALCAQLPVPWCCNNPECLNMSCESEQKLVGGKGCVCAGCQQARYCGAECQKQHWKQHMPVCKRLR